MPSDYKNMEALTSSLLEKAKNVVLDAGALTDKKDVLGRLKECLNRREVPAVITPHVGEFARLTGLTNKEVSETAEDLVIRFSGEYNCVTVLKSYKTFVGTPDGSLYVYDDPNSGLAKGGSGDVLAGLITGFLAQGMEPYKAACSAVFIHQKAGRAASDDIGARYMLPTDLLNYLPEGYQEASWSDVSNTFKTVSSLLESNMVSIDEGTLTAKIGNGEYTIYESEDGVVCKRVGHNGIENTFESAAELREHNNLVVAGSINRSIAPALEALALTFENYSNIANLDNVAIYTTNRDKFIVIESGTDLYSSLLQSNHNTKWTVNEDAISTLSFIKSKTNVELGEVYTEAIQAHMVNVDEEERNRLEEEAKVTEKNGYKERIAALTEKFKNDPAKLAILSELAAKLSTATD